MIRWPSCRCGSTPCPLYTPTSGNGFEQVRNDFFRGEGLGRDFLVKFLPCGNMRG
jgi:hypothetical protein